MKLTFKTLNNGFIVLVHPYYLKSPYFELTWYDVGRLTQNVNPNASIPKRLLFKLFSLDKEETVRTLMEIGDFLAGRESLKLITGSKQ